MQRNVEESSYWQQVRGLCILAVIWIHVLAEYILNVKSISNELLMFRQLINFPVPVFIFLSGYFTKQEKVREIKKYLRRRGGRLIIPYIMWSLVYCTMRGNITNFKSIMNDLLMGTASWQLYYIVILIQLVFVTPILLVFLEKNLTFYKVFYVVSWLCMVIKYYVKLDFLYSSKFPWCTEFLVFYLLGLQLGNKNNHSLRITTKKLLEGFLLLSLGLSFLEGKMWLNTGNYTMAMSQGKLSSYAYALCFIFYLVSKCKKKNNRTLIKSNGICKKIINMLQTAGDFSYGIFYIHCLILFACNQLWENMLGRPEESGVIYCFVIFIATYVVSFVLAYVGTKVLGKKYAAIIGLI